LKHVIQSNGLINKNANDNQMNKKRGYKEKEQELWKGYFIDTGLKVLKAR